MRLLLVLEVVLFGFLLCGTTLLMRKDDELCEEPEEVRCEGEGVVSREMCNCGERKKPEVKEDR
jgi:hypothetical protein